MLKLNLLNQNIFEVESEAIILPVDGYGKGYGGALARAFQKLYPKTWQEIENQIRYPLLLGNVFYYKTQEISKYRFILVAAILEHLNINSPENQQQIVENTFTTCLRYCINMGISSLATGLLTGGWRLEPQQAFQAMTKSISKFNNVNNSVEINLCILNTDIFTVISKIQLNS